MVHFNFEMAELARGGVSITKASPSSLEKWNFDKSLNDLYLTHSCAVEETVVLSDIEEDAEPIREAAARSLGLTRNTVAAAGGLGAAGGRGAGGQERTRGGAQERENGGKRAPSTPAGKDDRYKIPKKIVNSEKFSKEVRPPHLQDDEIVDAMDLNIVAQQVMKWAEIQVMKEANEIKAKKTDKNSMKKNTEIKPVKVEEGEDDATTKFHKQRFALRTPVVAPSKYWHLYPTEWKEVYYSVHLDHVGLENTLGQKQILLLHNRTNELKVHMFSQVNAVIGKEKLSTNINFLKDGSADIKSQEDWAALVSVGEVTMALDNLVAGWSVFWPGEHSMVTLRRVVSRQREFATISDVKKRKKLLEVFINKMLEINSKKAAQGDVPLTYKEILEQSKEYLEMPSDFIQIETNDQPYHRPVSQNFNHKASFNNASNQNTNFNQNSNFNQNTNYNQRNREDRPKRVSAEDYWELVKSIKVDGKEICILFNKRAGCKDKRCRKAHKCAFLEGGESKSVCGLNHSKFEHVIPGFKRGRN